MSKEPIITINGKILTNGQSMTIRIAIEKFASELQELGQMISLDRHDRLMREPYLKNIDEIREIILKKG